MGTCLVVLWVFGCLPGLSQVKGIRRHCYDLHFFYHFGSVNVFAYIIDYQSIMFITYKYLKIIVFLFANTKLLCVYLYYKSSEALSFTNLFHHVTRQTDTNQVNPKNLFSFSINFTTHEKESHQTHTACKS